jgi:2,4-dienoyl-CoA reductase-like NADH-dependent reductase (Old Yellow Enzyme family)
MEATGVAPEGRISPADAGLWKDSQIEPLRRITAFLKSQDCRAGIQLAHAGRKAGTYPPFFHPRAPAKLASQAVGPELGGWPSDVKGPSPLPYDEQHHTPHEMTREEIHTFKQQFVDAVLRAEKAGFEYIECHAAHGYLLSSFLSPTSNARTDEYGGSFENRIRLLMETIAEVRAVYKGVLGVRFSCSEWVEGGWSMDDSVRLAEELAQAQVDVIDCSSGGNNPAQKIDVRPGYQVPFAAQVRHHLQQVAPQVVVGAVGLITEPSQANDIVRTGQADLVLVARELLRDPYFPLHAATALGHDMDWAPQYSRAKPSVAKSSVP